MANPVVLEKERKCKFCKIKENNKLKYGPLYELTNMVAHYYCVLCSTRMKQNGKDNEGIMGFLLNDINVELRRTKKVICAYCPENNATVECAHSGCKKIFHFPCGLQNGALSRFRNDFATFCDKHRPKQKIPKKILNEVANTEVICAICYEEVQPTNRIDNLWAPCCLRTWYHRDCVQELAHSSGYFFRCATCNDVQKFKAHMEDNGIFVPQQDASWELVPNAYEELLVRHNRCDADNCKCPKGREENVEETRWEIILCRSCGSQGIHVGCGNLKFTEPQWECPTCQNIMKTKPKPTKVDEEYKSEMTVKKSSCSDQPETASRKRKMTGQPKTLNKRKRGKGNGDDPAGNHSGGRSKRKTGAKKPDDEFYIRIPGRKSDKPHTATRPDDEDDVEDHEDDNDEEDKASDKDTDEEVDVISVDTAWLMVEEVLSRVKPAPLSHKLKFLRKKVFSYHFDPFDVREEIETIDLASDSEDNSLLTSDRNADADSDIEFIGEVRESGKKEEPRKEQQEMDPNEIPCEILLVQEMTNLDRAPPEPEQLDNELFEVDLGSEEMELSDNEAPEEIEENDAARASEDSEAADEFVLPEQQEVIEEPLERSEGQVGMVSEVNVAPSNRRRKKFENRVRNRNEEINQYFEETEETDPESEFDFLMYRGGRNTYQVPQQQYEQVSNDNENNFQAERRVGKKHSLSRANYKHKVKRARTTTATATATNDNASADVGGQCQAQAESESPAIPPDSQRESSPIPPDLQRESPPIPPDSQRETRETTADSSSNLMPPTEQTFDRSVLTALDLTALQIVNPTHTSVLMPAAHYYIIDYGNNSGTHFLSTSAAPSTSTTIMVEPCAQRMEESMPSTSTVTLSFPYNSQMALSMTSSTNMGVAMPSGTGVEASMSSLPYMEFQMPSTSSMEVQMPSSSCLDLQMPSTSGMPMQMPSTSGMPMQMPSTSDMTFSMTSNPDVEVFPTSSMDVSVPTTTDTEVSMSPASGRHNEPGECTPLPTFQYLSSLHANIPPLLSSVSSSSSSSVANGHSNELTQSTENSLSSEGSNDVFLEDENDLRKSAP